MYYEQKILKIADSLIISCFDDTFKRDSSIQNISGLKRMRSPDILGKSNDTKFVIENLIKCYFSFSSAILMLISIEESKFDSEIGNSSDAIMIVLTTRFPLMFSFLWFHVLLSDLSLLSNEFSHTRSQVIAGKVINFIQQKLKINEADKKIELSTNLDLISSSTKRNKNSDKRADVNMNLINQLTSAIMKWNTVHMRLLIILKGSSAECSDNMFVLWQSIDFYKNYIQCH